jgi:hypothetical protein
VLRNGLLHNIVTLASAFSTSPDRLGVPREVQPRSEDLMLELPQLEVGIEIGMAIVGPLTGSC